MLNLFENTALKVFRTCNHLPATSVLQDQILNRSPQTGAPNRSPEQMHIRAGSLGQALQDDKVSGSDHIASICFLRIVSSSCYMLLTYHPRDPRLRRSLLAIVFLQEFNCVFFVQWFADQMSLYSIATPFLQILFLPFVFYPFSYSKMT